MNATNTRNRLPSSLSSVDLQACERYCVFQYGDACFGVLATTVREVALRPKVSVVPGAGSMLVGLCHLRNEFLPVVQLRDGVFDVNSSAQKQQIVVVSAAGGSWALLVDRVIGLVPLEVSLSSEGNSAMGWSSSVMGSASHDDKIVQVIDANALFRYFDSSLSQGWQANNASQETLVTP